jgi:prepilin-type N-terminal cleavage/methylation domain-containing protein
VNPFHSTTRARRRASGFTLVELLIVIVIIAALVALSFMGIGKFTDKGRMVQALAQFRDLETGMVAFEIENNRPMLPQQERMAGRDTVFGDVGGQYSNDFIVAVLMGDAPRPWRAAEVTFKDVNPRGETYLELPYSDRGSNGVGRDGVLYDPWGRELMIAVNAFKGPGNDAPLRDENGGENDRILETYRVGEYRDTKPRDQSFVFWSFGKDGKKGNGAPTKTARVNYIKSDDVISWQP